MSVLHRKWARYAASAYFSATVLLSSAAIASIYLDNGLSSGGPPLLICIFLTFFHFVIYLVILSFNRKRGFLYVYLSGGIIITSSILYIGISMNVDYLRSAFHALGSLFLIFLFKKEFFSQKKLSKESIKTLLYLTLIVYIAGFVWILLHAYHGIILGSPGTEYWIIFNLYSLGILIIGLDVIFSISSSLYLQVHITDDSLFIDDKDFSQLLGKKEIQVLRLMVRNEHGHTSCSSISRELLAANNNKTERPDCGLCIREKHKATLCPEYKKIYNQVLKIKIFLETMRIGTILSPENKMNITREGWVFRVFKHVRIILKLKD